MNAIAPEGPTVGVNLDYDEPLALAVNHHWRGKPSKAEHRRWDTSWERAILTPSQVLTLLTEDGGAITCSLKKPGARNSGTFDALNLVGLDFDQTGIDDVLKHPLAQYASFAYESSSSTPDAPRCRLIFALADALDFDAAQKAIAALQHAFASLRPDPAAKDPTRCWYGSVGKRSQWIGGLLDGDVITGLIEALPESLTPEPAVAPVNLNYTVSTEPPDLNLFGPTEKEIDYIHHPLKGDGNNRHGEELKIMNSLVSGHATDEDIYNIWKHYPIGSEGRYSEQGQGDRYLAMSIAKARGNAPHRSNQAAIDWWDAKRATGGGNNPDSPEHAPWQGEPSQALQGDAEPLADPTQGPTAGGAQTTGNAPPSLRRFATHDSGNADAFMALHGKNFAWNESFGWLWFNKTHWVNGGEGETRARRAMELTLLARTSELAGTKAMIDVIPSAKNVRGSLFFAQSRVYMHSSAYLQAENKHLLNTSSGVVNLRTGDLRKATPEDRFLWCVKTPYEPLPTDSDKVWRDLVLDWVSDAEDMADYLQLGMGYSITGESSEKCLFFLLGELGNNGKTTFTRAVSDALDSAIVRGISLDVFTVKSRLADTQGFGLAPLVHARYVPASEGDLNGALKGNVVKALTSHGDPMQVAEKGKQPIEWHPNIKIWAMSNHPPKMSDDDAVGWQRFRIIKFDRTYTEDEIDPRLGEKLRTPEMRAAILRWLVEGAKRWYAKRLPMPQAIVEANKTAALANNSGARFVEECVVADPNGALSPADIRVPYLAWCLDNGVDEADRKNDVHLGRALGAKGFVKKNKTWQVAVVLPTA